MKNRYKIRIKMLAVTAILSSSLALGQEKSDYRTDYSRADLGTTSQKDLVVAAGKIQGESLKSYPDLVLSNSLQGKAAGLVVRMTNNGLGNNEADIFVRGLSTNGNSQAIVIIDGIERPFNDLLAEEIESIEVLKDAPAKILYGPAAANGVLVVKTKRGIAGTRMLRLSAEMGLMEATRTPQYLDSYHYATLYNEARSNDGLPDLYQPYQLDGYKNSKGANDVLYPNVDWYDYFLKKQSTYKKFTFEANGGNQRLRYAMVAGYVHGGGFENVGTAMDLDRLNLRGNLDIAVTDYLNVVADVAGRMENRSWGDANTASVFDAVSNNHPNEFPLTISADSLGLTPDAKGRPYFGASTRRTSNLLADMAYRGTTGERYITSQTNVGLDFNLNKFVKGLTFSTFLTFDNYTYVKQALTKALPTYLVRPFVDESGLQHVQYSLLTKLDDNDDLNVTDNQTRRSTGWRANGAYRRSLGANNLSLVAGYRFYKNETKGAGQDNINCNYTARLNYDYAKKYLLEWNSAYMGNNKFAPGNRFFLSSAGAVGWVLSNEGFLSGSDKVNFLKVKASYGQLGFSGNTDYLLYNTRWNDGGTIALNEGNTGNAKVVNLVRVGNPDLKWEKSLELNIGVEGTFLGNRLKGEVNYFNEERSDIIGTMNTSYAAYSGPFTRPTNIGSVENRGFDGSISWGEKVGKLDYRIGLNCTVSRNKLLSWDENNVLEGDRKSVGKQTDAIFGLQALGLFGRDVDLSTATLQNLGRYGVGDLAYADRNGDGIVDTRDEMKIGHSFPTSTFGLDVTLKYGHWGLYALGTSELGVNKLLTNSYYWNNGDSKYSVIAEQRYHPVNNPTGKYPALTSKEGTNSYRNSDFWIADASFFRLKNVELSYTFGLKGSTAYRNTSMKLFARGTNVLVLSKIKDLDPEVLGAGVSNNPVTAFYTGGVSFTF